MKINNKIVILFFRSYGKVFNCLALSKTLQEGEKILCERTFNLRELEMFMTFMDYLLEC